METLIAHIAKLAPATPPAPAFRRLSRFGLAIIAVAILAVAATGSASAEVTVTGAADNMRTGWYPDESSLTPALLEGGSFKQVFKTPLQGQIYAQPLTANGTLLVATEDNWVYGLNPSSGAVRWARQFGTPVESGEGKTIDCPDLQPHTGITGTPVIDTEHDIAYFVSNQYISGSSGPIAWYMHGVDLANGEEVMRVEIKGEAQNRPGVSFEAAQQLQRPALLMMNGVVYAGFGSHCDNTPYEGWIAGVSASGQLTTMWASSAKGGSIWQSGGGLVSDGPGQILFTASNEDGAHGEGDPGPGPGNNPPSGLGESVIRAAVQPGGGLRAADFFSPFNSAELDENGQDLDLGSAAPVALPEFPFGTNKVPHLLVQASKQGWLYLLNRDELGGMGQGLGGGDKIVQRLGPYGGVWGSPAVWPGDEGYVYLASVAPFGSGATTGGGEALRFFKAGVDAKGEPTLLVAAESNDGFAFGSGSPIVTSNGAQDGTALVWITHCSATSTPCSEADLRAYSAVPAGESPKPLWEAPIGNGTKFSRPDASNGRIYVGNREGDVFAFSGPHPPAESPPTVATGAASSVTQSSATLNATVNPNGEEVSYCGLEYGTSTSYTASALCTPSAGSSTTPVAVSASVAGLSANTTYHFRIVAANATSQSAGADQTFTTPPATPLQEPGALGTPLQEPKAPVPDAELVSTSLGVSSSGTFSVKVRCPAGESRCTGTVTVTLRTLIAVGAGRGHRSRRKLVTLILAVGSFRVAGGKVVTVKLHLSAKGRTLLARAHLLRVRATIVARDAAGATHTTHTTVTIRTIKATHARKR